MLFTQIGFTKKCHGVTGEIKVAIEEVYEDLFLESERVYIEVRGTKMPYFLEQARGKGDLIVKFEDIKDRDQALIIQSKPIFLPTAEIPAGLEVEEDVLEYAYITGFVLVDKTAGEIGPIDEVIDMPQQEMALIRYKKRDILIPLNDELIIDINKKSKRVMVDLPDGLLDL